MSICSGASALAAAGALDGRTATTHWIYTDQLRELYPAVDVVPAPLYVDNGRVLTSAGCAAGLDLCLHIVRPDHGMRVANDVARRLVVSPQRAGGQAQYIETPVPEPSTDGRIAAGWLGASVSRQADQPRRAGCAIDVVAEEYLRQFAKVTGTTPIKWLIEQRIQASLVLLESSSHSIEIAPGTAAPSEDELKDLVRHALPVYHVPVAFTRVEALPRNPGLNLSLPAVAALYAGR